MHKQVIKADVPETAGPFNLCVRHGNMIYISGPPGNRFRHFPTCRSSGKCAS
jgi:hypothetical protein